MQQQEIYIKRSIDEKPEPGKYLVIAPEWDELPFKAVWDGSRWDDERDFSDFTDMVTHYLQPATRYVLTAEELAAVKREAFEAGENRQWGISWNEYHPEDTVSLAPDLETYLTTIK